MSAPVHQLILASAGTGKTYQLTNQLLRLLFREVEPQRILATTFTRKAAGEILDRALDRLVEATERPEKLNELREALGSPDITADRCRALLSKLVRGLDTLQVRTIDSFFVHLVHLFALDLELPPTWGISGEGEDEILRAEAMQDVLEETPRDEVIRLLRGLDAGAVGRSVHKRMLDHASKMRPVFLESAEEAWERVDPGTKPSEQEFAAALAALPEAEVPTTQKGEPHKSWVKALETVAVAASDRDWEKILTQGLGKAFLGPEQTFSGTPIPDALAEHLAPIVRRAVYEFLVTLRARNRTTHLLLERFESSFSRRKRDRGAYRFDDLPLALSPRAASELPIDARSLDMWFRLDSRIDHLLLDEFQDTSPIQWRILHKMASEIAADGSGERTFFCVGDVKQSIYGFRHGEPRLLAELPRMLPGLQPEEIHESYRSSQVVLDTVNRVFSGVEDNAALAHEDAAAYLPGARRWQDGFREHTAAKDLPGATFLVEARQETPDDRTDDSLLECAVERAVLISREAPQATVGILMRERKHIAELIHRLRQERISASGEGGSELTDSEAVLAFVSLLHLADHPGDSAAAFHVGSSRLGGIVGLPKDADPGRRQEVSREIRARLTGDGLGAFCAEVRRRIADDDSWSTWDKLRFEQLCELAFAFEGKASLRSSDFVDHLRSERVESPSGARVRVMTIHGSKGLEFDAVILPELHKKFIGRREGPLVDRPQPDGLIQTVSVSPRKETLAADENLMALYDETTARMFEDGLCNLYVAMTRAARRLDLIVPWSDPEKEIKIPRVADLVRAAMPQDELRAPDAAGVIWSHPANAPGAGWARGLEPDSSEPEGLEPAPISLGLAPSDRPRTLPRRSPSSEEGGRLVRAEALFRDKRGARRGTLIHRWLEDLVWIEDFHLDEARALEIGVPFEPNPETRRETLSVLTRALQAEPVRSALSREHCAAPADAALEVHNEHSFSVLLPDDSGEEQLWSGSVDRLILAHRGDDVVWAEVLDYKSDILTAEELPDRIEYYRPQLESYGRVVATQTGLAAPEIRLGLLFLELGRVVEIVS
jgi:ATP-dependent exoDNAse (exonuclease V) beta subunit